LFIFIQTKSGVNKDNAVKKKTMKIMTYLGNCWWSKHFPQPCTLPYSILKWQPKIISSIGISGWQLVCVE